MGHNLLSLSEVVTLCPTNLFIVLDDSLGGTIDIVNCDMLHAEGGVLAVSGWRAGSR